MRGTFALRWLSSALGASVLVATVLVAPAGAIQPVPFAPGYFLGTYDTLIATASAATYGLVYDGHGNFYVGVAGNVDRITSTGSVSTFATGIGSSDVTALAIDANGDIWAGGYSSDIIHVYKPNGTLIRSITTTAADCSGIAFDDLGHSYFTDYEDSEIFKMNLDGTHQSVILSSGISEPWGLAYNHHGQLIIGDGDDSRVASVNLDGSNLTNVFNLPGGGFASSVQVLASGQILAAGYSTGKFFVINPNGSDAVTYTSNSTVNRLGAAIFDPATQSFYYTQTGSSTLRRMQLNPYAQATSTNAATVTWLAPSFNAAPVTSYTLSAVPMNGTQTVSVVVPANQTTATIFGLSSAVTYRFNVFGTNSYGDGGISASSNPVLIGASAPSAVKQPSAVSLNQAARISWSAPSNGGSPVTAYFVSAYDDSSNGYALDARISVPASSTSLVLGSLSEGHFYRFEVTALNSVGFSTSSPDSNDLLVIGVPTWVNTTPPSATALSKSAKVTWVAATAHGAPVTSYVVSASPGGKTCTTTGALSCTVKGLSGAKSYHFNVVAKDSAGSSASSVNSNTVKVKS
jgi:sugar lactone lactonase YvrE